MEQKHRVLICRVLITPIWVISVAFFLWLLAGDSILRSAPINPSEQNGPLLTFLQETIPAPRLDRVGSRAGYAFFFWVGLMWLVGCLHTWLMSWARGETLDQNDQSRPDGANEDGEDGEDGEDTARLLSPQAAERLQAFGQEIMEDGTQVTSDQPRVFSVAGLVCASILGAELAAGILVAINFGRMGNRTAQKMTWILIAPSIIAAVAVNVFLDDLISEDFAFKYVFLSGWHTLVCVWVVWYLQADDVRKQIDSGAMPEPIWKSVVIGVGCLLAFFLLGLLGA